MKFSVLMSLYAKENANFLDTCLRSIWIDQTIKPDEIIIVIDGEIGLDLQHIVNKWQVEIPAIIKVLPLPYNVGLGQALNEGLKNCNNEWVFRMDTDDISTPDRFEKQIEFIKDNHHVVLFGGQILEFNHIPHDSDVIKFVPTSNDEIKQFSLRRCPFNHMTVAYKKDAILSLGGYQHHMFMEDYNLWLRVISAGHEVRNLADVILYARVGNGMHARRKGFEYIKSEKQLLNLKKQLKLQNSIHANMLFLVRSVFRLIPSSLLGKIYNTFLRKKVKK